MKVATRGIILTTTCLLLVSAFSGHAIEGLKLSVQCSNVVLSWPCLDDGSETFIVQYRPTLAAATPWQTLTNHLPAEVGTNLAFYVHSNVVQNPSCGCGTMGDQFQTASAPLVARRSSIFDLGVPLAKRADGTGVVVPLSFYRRGVDLSKFLIYDPAICSWLDGSSVRRESLQAASSLSGGPFPDSGGGGTNAAPETGFYQVVREGIHLLGITNGIVLSGRVALAYEFGNADTNRSMD
jgi:hypothetical protein